MHEPSSPAGAATSPTIVVLLGASNLTRGISTVVETLRLKHGPPLRVVAALGHGRSYGLHSSVLGRSLCSILECGLWDALPTHAPAGAVPLRAVLTDIGNDVMYGAAPRQIISWVEQCVDRLEARGVQSINITALPIESIRSVKRWQYAIVRSLLFPTRNISFETAIARAFETQALLEDLATRRAGVLRLIGHERRWYGFDPIHIRLRYWTEAWSRFIAPSTGADTAHASRARGSLARWARLRMHMPERYHLLGWPRTRSQPIRLNGGICVEMY